MSGLNRYVVWDQNGSDAEEWCHVLIAATSEEEAVAIWRSHFEHDPEIHDPVADIAKWLRADEPEPVPAKAGLWDPAEFRGYGFGDEGDVHCGACCEYVDPNEWNEDADTCARCAAVSR